MTSAVEIADFRPAARRRVHEDIAEQLRDAILDGRFPAGSKLPPEREMAIKFKVNRTTISYAIRVLEGLNLVCVRQGDAATVQPLVNASFDVLPAMIFHGGRVDAGVLQEVLEVTRPLVFEMAKLALERSTKVQIEALSALSGRMGDEDLEDDDRAAAGRDLLVAIADMTGNRVWRMLARRLQALLASDPLQEARRGVRKNHTRLAVFVSESIEHHKAGRREKALGALRRALEVLGQGFNDYVQSGPAMRRR
ncbi:MAG TPA: GntR family transcriptional regulator [Candidatus Binataceae bacterium]|nr:GntR family transcriptional regulator [Candidatus Binataceae bacterium]